MTETLTEARSVCVTQHIPSATLYTDIVTEHTSGSQHAERLLRHHMQRENTIKYAQTRSPSSRAHTPLAQQAMHERISAHAGMQRARRGEPEHWQKHTLSAPSRKKAMTRPCKQLCCPKANEAHVHTPFLTPRSNCATIAGARILLHLRVERLGDNDELDLRKPSRELATYTRRTVCERGLG